LPKNYILHIASWFPNKYSLFNGDFVQRHINTLTNCQNVVLHAHIGREVEKEELEIEQKENSENWLFYSRLPRMTPFPFAQSRALKKILAKLIEEKGKPDLVHIHVMQYASLIIPYVKKKYNLPVVVTEHSTLFSSTEKAANKNLKIKLCQFNSKKADYIFPVSTQLKNALVKHGFSNPLKVIFNVVPDYFFESQKMKGNQLRFLHVSSLKNGHKNIEGMLTAFKKFSLVNSDFHLTIIGNTNHDITLKRINQAGLKSDQYSLLGPLSHEEIANQMSKHDVFVLFSNYENYPCVLIEAQASGLRLIATDVGGVSEILGEDDALIQAKDEDHLFKSLMLMAQEYQYKPANDIRRKAKEKYDAKIIGRQMEDIYDQLIKKS